MNKKVVVLAFCSSLLFGCSNSITIPVPSATPSTQASAANVTPIVNKYKYDLPIKFKAREEGVGGNSKDLYEIKDDTFTYNLDEQVLTISPGNIVNDKQSKKLSAEEIAQVKKVLNEVDINALAEKDTPIPKDAPQTLEYRTIVGFTVVVDGKEKLFERNGRDLKHTQEYLDGFTKIENTLKDLKAKFVKNVEINQEFTLKIGEAVNFEGNILKADSLTEESRCPANVQCIQAGEVSFKFKLYDHFMDEVEFTLTSRAGNNDLGMKKINNYTYTLVKVLPESFDAAKTPQPSDYILTLKITKN